MDISNISISLFLIVTLLYLWWLLIIYRRNMVKSIYFIYYCFSFTVFYGPILYYRLGFDGYIHAIKYEAFLIFYYISILVAGLNMAFYLYTTKFKLTALKSFLQKISFDKITNHKLLTHYFVIVNVVCLVYILVYREYFPLTKLIDQGELGERLDISGAIPFYISFSTLFMVIIPSSFLYFRQRLKSKLVISILFLFTLFALSAGGNKGVTSFFLIFYLLLCTKNQSIFKYIVLFFTLAIIYLVFKGYTEYNADTLEYLIESPFRRLFAAQGSGFIVRIDMMLKDLFVEGYEIKQQVYARIYNSYIGVGSSPTHFIGDVIVKYGFFIALFIYLIYLNFFTKILVTVSNVYKNDVKSSFIVWNFFVIAFITTNSDITLANFLRTIVVVFNLLIISYVSKVKTKI